MRISQEDILNALQHHVWKSGTELRKEISRAKGKKENPLGAGTIYVTLNRLEEEGWVESRKRECASNHNPLLRDYLPQREYKLTEDGIRHRYERKKKETKLTGDPIQESS